MLSSRPQHALFVDKENVLGNAPSRKGSALSASSQNLLKTPSVKQQPLGGAKTVKATSSKQAMGTTHVRSHKNSGAATIALEPGARVLSVKDSNNRSGLMARASQQGGKDKGKRLDTVYDDCSLMPSITQGATVSSSSQIIVKSEKKVKITSTPASRVQQQPSNRTPARPKTRSTPEDAEPTVAPLKTPAFEPSFGRTRVSPGHNSLFPSLSAFKTPSPNHLLRRRKGAASPVPLHFNPTSLRGDDVVEDPQDCKPPKPTLLEELDAQHALLDDNQEPDAATRQAVDPEDLPVDLPFDMPDYRSMDVLGINFKVTSTLPPPFLDDAPPISLDDSDMYTRDCLYEAEVDQPPIFPRLKQVARNAGMQQASISTGVQRTTGHDRFAKLAVRQATPKAGSSGSLASNAVAGEQRSRQVQVNRFKASPLRASPANRSVGLQKVAAPSVYITLQDYPEVVPFNIGAIDLLL